MIAIVADIHGNLPALRAVIASAESRGCKRIISLGDVTGYYAQPGECIALLREYNAIHLMGNHDAYLVTRKSCPRSQCVSKLIAYQRSVITASQLEWLAKSSSTWQESDKHFVHGGWHDPIDEYIYKISEAALPDDHGQYFSGHTHVQVMAEFPGKTYCNPGSVGQPRDGDPRAAFAILSGDDITLHRVAYNIDDTARVMQAKNFPPRLYECLYIGAQIGGRVDAVVVE